MSTIIVFLLALALVAAVMVFVRAVIVAPEGEQCDSGFSLQLQVQRETAMPDPTLLHADGVMAALTTARL